MILQALKMYYDRKASDPNSDIAPPGWERKELPFLIVLDENGIPVSIEDTREMAGKAKRAKCFLLPQSVKRAMGIAANLLWDNAEYAVGAVCKGRPERVRQQHEAFLSLIQPHGDLPAARAVLAFLKREDREDLLSAFPEWKEIRETCAFLSFKIAGALEPVFRDPGIVVRVSRDAAAGADLGEPGICLVTGDRDEAARLHPAIKGVMGANTTGGNIVSFNFSAAESFGKKQGANAQVGKGAAFAYTTALNTLLGKDSKQKMQVGDATAVFWSDRKTELEEDFGDFWAEPPKDDPDQLTNAVESLFKSAENGALACNPDATKFFVLGLAPNAARLAIRFWHVGTVDEMGRNIRAYFEDLRIAHGARDRQDLSLWRLLVSTAVQGKSENIAPNLAGNVMRCILDGLPFPETLLQATILRIKAERDVSYPRAKLIKGCLNRKFRSNSNNKERMLTMSLDRENADVGYRLGRLFAVLEKIQQEANPGINATIRDK
ncbi:MAG: type I-C CRISPR-associated protein Cas8c/Csd1, partial [Lentisphaerae bacterium]|nr:type I-C CRISPR-associated protein Cas8c/Csd1 [Lentisphaerota bacterium]